MNSKTRILIITAVAFFLPILLCVLSTVLLIKSDIGKLVSEINSDKKIEQVEEVKINSFTVDLNIEGVGQEVTNYKVEVSEGESVLNVLEKAKEQGLQFEVTEYSFGVMIKSINSYEPDSSKEFWKFMVNGEEAQVGVSDYVLKKGDSVLFTLDEIEF